MKLTVQVRLGFPLSFVLGQTWETQSGPKMDFLYGLQGNFEPGASVR